jgi:superoxide dismutase, Fe-Mn family
MEKRDEQVSRREFFTGALRKATAGTRGPFFLPKLAYSDSDLAPYISAQTIELHYGKHHAGYIAKLNEMVRDTPMADMSLEQILKDFEGGAERTPLFNMAAQTWNHNFYWKSLKPHGGGAPKGKLRDLIQLSFGSLENLNREWSEKANARFASGWAWLVVDGHKLKVIDTHDADTPLVHGLKPLLTIDVWEHAYYLDYQNRREEYVDAVLDHLINWDFAADNLG